MSNNWTGSDAICGEGQRSGAPARGLRSSNCWVVIGVIPVRGPSGAGDDALGGAVGRPGAFHGRCNAGGTRGVGI